MESMIPFNKPYLAGNEMYYIKDAIKRGHLSGNGYYTKKCQHYFEKKYKFGKCLLTTSCTDALEMAAILMNICSNDEVIIPAYTFVSSANPFIMRGARIKFVDSKKNHPSLDEDKIEELITKNTKAIVVVHYAGISCDMEKIMAIAKKYNIFIVEDAAQAIDNHYVFADGTTQPLGTFGQFATFSFHETKNIISGEGGLLVINDETYFDRSEIIWEKGTNRNAFFKGIVDKYNWVDIGSSFLPSELIAAFLYSQLESMDKIQKQRQQIWENYSLKLGDWAVHNQVGLPLVPPYSQNNFHIFYLIFLSQSKRDEFISKLKKIGVMTVFHYLSLHQSPFFKNQEHPEFSLENSEKFTDCLVRLPLYCDLSEIDQEKIINAIVN